MNAKIKILHLEYIADESALINSILLNAGIDCTILPVSTRQAYIEALNSFIPHIILSDYALPNLTAIDALTLLKENGLSIPLIVITTPASDNMAQGIVNIMKLGAFDYILKENIETLPDAILSAIKKHISNANILLSEQRYRQIVETAQEGIWILDENMVTLFVNKKMCDILEYSADEILGKHNYDFRANNDKTGTFERAEKRKLGSVEAHESTFISKSGKPIICIVATNGLFDSDNRYLGTMAMITDITKRKADEEALKRSEANLSAIIENTTDLVYSLDTNLNFITFNQMFKNITQQVYGFNIEQGINTLDMLAKFDKEMAAKWAKIYATALAGETLQFVNEYDFGQGKVYLNYSINPIWDAGKVIGLSCFSRDITRQKLDEAAIRKSEASLRTIFNNTDMGCMLLDNDGKIVSFNNLAKKFSAEQGYIIEERGYIVEYVEKQRQPIVVDILEKAKNGNVINYQLKLEFNGVIKWYDITWAGIKDHEHAEFGYIFTSKDITEKKILEIERERITTDLLQRNKALEQFTYIISHNLRAPVANIIGLSSLIAGIDTGNNDVVKIVDSINLSANKLDDVISDLNQVLQVNEGKNENIELINLSGLVESIKASIDYIIEKERVTIAYDFSKVNELFSLKSFIHSIFYNLILNSIKYRVASKQPVINISTTVDNGKILIAFNDNGRGIDTSRYEKEIFGLYKRFDTTVEGKGMGLFMVKMQVESLGGNISVRSTLNEGTEFMIEFPQNHID